MRQTFDELPPKRQLQIVNAAMEVFGKNSYKHASTEEIAYRAGWIGRDAVEHIAAPLKKNGYGQYLLNMIDGGEGQ